VGTGPKFPNFVQFGGLRNFPEKESPAEADVDTSPSAPAAFPLPHGDPNRLLEKAACMELDNAAALQEQNAGTPLRFRFATFLGRKTNPALPWRRPGTRRVHSIGLRHLSIAGTPPPHSSSKAAAAGQIPGESLPSRRK